MNIDERDASPRVGTISKAPRRHGHAIWQTRLACYLFVVKHRLGDPSGRGASVTSHASWFANKGQLGLLRCDTVSHDKSAHFDPLSQLLLASGEPNGKIGVVETRPLVLAVSFIARG